MPTKVRPSISSGRQPHIFFLIVVLIAAASLMTAPLATVAAPAQSFLTAEEPVFASRVETAPLPNPVPLPQDVVGVVLDRNGRGLPGVWVQVKSEGGWEASTATRGDGSFYFTLTEGRFSAVLVDRVSQPAFIRVDGKTAIRVVFQEVTLGATPTPPSLTPPPTLVPTTPTAERQPTSPPARPRGTPTPSVTPLSALPPTTPSGSSPPGWPGMDPWLGTFVAGIALGAAAFLVALIALRRR